MSSEVTKMASDLVDKSATEAIRIYGEIKTKGEEMINEINAKEQELKEDHVTVLPWLLPEFKDMPLYQSMVKDDIFLLSKDLDTFLKSVEGCEDDQYSPANNSQLIVLLRDQDTRLQKARLLLVQKEKVVDDDHFWRNYIFRVLQIIKNYKKTIEEEKEGKVKMDPVKEESPKEESVESSMEVSPSLPPDSHVSVVQPMEAPKSTIPEVVHTVEDIYDFDDMSDIEKEMGDVDLEGIEEGDLSDIEAEILAEL